MPMLLCQVLVFNNKFLELFSKVYQELRRIAGRLFRTERPGRHTLQPTAVIHEAYMQLAQGKQASWQSSGHFYGIMARLMRRVLIDHARRRGRVKRGGGVQHAELNPASLEALSSAPSPDLVDLDDALQALEQVDPQKAAITELRFFGGLTSQETADTLGISRATVVREQRRAFAWLTRELRTP